MLQPLERQRKYIGVILSDEHTLPKDLDFVSHYFHFCFLGNFKSLSSKHFELKFLLSMSEVS